MNTTAHINRAAGYSKTSGKLGHVLSAEEKLRMYTLKEIVNTEEEYVQLLQFIVEVRWIFVVIRTFKVALSDPGWGA